MKQLTCVCAIVVLGLVAITTVHVSAADGEHSVTGAAKCLFGAGADLGPVALEGIMMGTGVYIEADGSASGTFHAVFREARWGTRGRSRWRGTSARARSRPTVARPSAAPPRSTGGRNAASAERRVHRHCGSGRCGAEDRLNNVAGRPTHRRCRHHRVEGTVAWLLVTVGMGRQGPGCK